MIWHIVNEIRRMERRYHRKHGHLGEVICLDANAEARLAAYIVYEFSGHHGKFIFTIEEVLTSGIRNVGTRICGMRCKFDCTSFRISI